MGRPLVGQALLPARASTGQARTPAPPVPYPSPPAMMTPIQLRRLRTPDIMKAIQLQAPERFAVIDVPEPPAPGPGEALVRVHRVGICGTDVSGYLGTMPF